MENRFLKVEEQIYKLGKRNTEWTLWYGNETGGIIVNSISFIHVYIHTHFIYKYIYKLYIWKNPGSLEKQPAPDLEHRKSKISLENLVLLESKIW